MTQDLSVPMVTGAVRRMCVVEGFAFTIAAAVVIVSAILTKQTAIHGQQMMSLAQLDPGSPDLTSTRSATQAQTVSEVRAQGFESQVPEFDLETRWFDGRPVRPARVLWMTVTGYSPDERSCGEFADGQTATLHSVWTNGMRIVAADTDVLEYGSMLTVPGYGDEAIVPVLDCGGAIKGPRLDVLFATHEQALHWGVRQLPVVVWEYADGEPAPNPRESR